MSAAILTRLFIALLIAAAGFGLYWLVNRALLRRARRAELGLESLKPGIPAILYFTTPDCAPCKTVQRPALDELRALLGDGLQVIEVDAAAEHQLADYWGVLSVPTTFIIDSRGRPRHVNLGATRAAQLLRQLEQAEGRSLADAAARDAVVIM